MISLLFDDLSFITSNINQIRKKNKFKAYEYACHAQQHADCFTDCSLSVPLSRRNNFHDFKVSARTEFF